VFDRVRPLFREVDGAPSPAPALALPGPDDRSGRMLEWIGRLIAYGAVLLLGVLPGMALGWGASGHAVIALIADQHLQPAAWREVHRLLASDTSGLADPDDIGDQANWADRYRDSHGRGARYHRTRQWHFVDLDLRAPDLMTACHGRIPLREGQNPASGPAKACVIDKILQFRQALADPVRSDRARLRALQFLLHLTGDVHQPLHASNNGDAGGNDRRVSLAGERTDSLHHYWDTVFVERLAGRLVEGASGISGAQADVQPRQPAEGVIRLVGAGDRLDLEGRLTAPDHWGHRGATSAIWPVAAFAKQPDGTKREARAIKARVIADLLLERIRDADIVEWSIRDPEAWAWESYRVARKEAYGRLRKPDRKGIHRLTGNYARHAEAAVALQLSRAGIRLAGLLNETLAPRFAGA
jgi:hypothetical protein